ncbi:TetR/AcrR family transcriptional regulator [Martelella mangrovi]|uniref:AcrR family transcriptional regulator n=1 Tax=Martelella mangrovi TaxID=1397477 RepID=A0ABV2IC95_9HYPH
MRTSKVETAMRADAAANKARIIEAARAEFVEGHKAISLEAVARKAGVGIATLYRHFGSRDALAAAVYHREVDELVDLAAALGDDLDPVQALRTWLAATVDFVSTKKGMAEALRWSARVPDDLTAYSSDHLTIAVGHLLERAVPGQAGRPRMEPQDLLRVLVALCYEFDQEDWQQRVLFLLDTMLDGLIGRGP